jgi:hypothetical protein
MSRIRKKILRGTRKIRRSRQKGGAEVNGLYLGMATDIATALYLVPDITTLFAINKLDDAYGSWDEHMRLIKQILIDGNDSSMLQIIPPEERIVTNLSGPSEILNERLTDTVWTLDFRYNGLNRKLVYYYDTDFLDIWPINIKNIQHLFFMGAFSWRDFTEYGDSSKTIIKMIETRSRSPWIYALAFNHRKFPIHSLNSFQEKGRTISKIHFDTFEESWWRHEYE